MRKRFSGLVLSMFLVAGCDNRQREVAGPYHLEKFENDTYYLMHRDEPTAGGGCLDGTVTKIAWTNGFIFARRQALASSDPNGWMIIDVDAETIEGPLSDEAFTARYPNIKSMSAESAWQNLK